MACRTGDNVPFDLDSRFTSLISKEIKLFTVNTGRLSTNKSGSGVSVSTIAPDWLLTVLCPLCYSIYGDELLSQL